MPHFGHRKVTDITPYMVDAWHAGASKDAWGSDCAERLLCLERHHAPGGEVPDDRRESVPDRGAAADAAHPRPNLSVPDFLRILEALPSDLQPLILLMLGAHLRLGEACSLIREDLDLEDRTLRVERQLQDGQGGCVVTRTENSSRWTV